MGRSIADLGNSKRESDINSYTPSQRRAGALQQSATYKVALPPRKNLVSEFKYTLKETLFADDPLRPFKDQPKKKKFLLGLQALFPVLDWGRYYSFRKFKGDLISGLTIASLCIPQDIGYAKLANLDVQYGLYSSFVPPLIYAAMGSSRDIAIGPVAVVSLLLGTLLREEVDPVKQKEEYTRLAFTATFFAGVTQFTLGFFRLGFVIDFLSHAAIVGFMGGAAITIALQQLKGFLGIQNFTKKTDIVSVMRSVWQSVHHGWNWQTIVIAASFMAFLLVTKYIGKKNKKLFWVPAIAPLLSVIISTFFVYITRADKKGVQIVKHIRKGINPSSAHKIFFTGPNLGKGFRIGVISGMIALTEAVAIGRTFASMKDYNIDGNKEMVALGTMNIIGSLTSCYVATGSFSRSAVNYMAGCQTAVSNMVMSLVVLLTLEVITPLFKYTPNAILASIIISAVINLIDYEAALLIWKIDKLDFVACMGAFFGVVFVSVEVGLLIAVAISFAKILLQVTRPRTALLGNLPRTTIYRNIEQYPEATKVPGVLILRVDSAIYFSNSNYVRERTLRWLADEAQMEARQFKRFAEEKMAHDQQELVALEDLLYKREQALHALSCEVQAYRHRLLSYGISPDSVDHAAAADPETPELDFADTGAESPTYEYQPAFEYPQLRCQNNHLRFGPSLDEEDAGDIDVFPPGDTPQTREQLHNLEKRIHHLERTQNRCGTVFEMSKGVVVEQSLRPVWTEHPSQASADTLVSPLAGEQKLCNSERRDGLPATAGCSREDDDSNSDRVYTVDAVHRGVTTTQAPTARAYEDSVETPREAVCRVDMGVCREETDIKKLYLRLEALEADRESMRQALMSMRTDKAQLVLLKEIAQHLYRDAASPSPPPGKKLVKKPTPPGSSFFVSMVKWILSFVLWKRRAQRNKHIGGLSNNCSGLLLLLEKGPRMRQWRCFSRVHG